VTALSVGPAVALLRRGAPVPAAEAGGKGAALDRLAQEDFPVAPAGPTCGTGPSRDQASAASAGLWTTATGQ
jgi:hypothetical protein